MPGRKQLFENFTNAGFNTKYLNVRSGGTFTHPSGVNECETCPGVDSDTSQYHGVNKALKVLCEHWWDSEKLQIELGYSDVSVKVLEKIKTFNDALQTINTTPASFKEAIMNAEKLHNLRELFSDEISFRNNWRENYATFTETTISKIRKQMGTFPQQEILEHYREEVKQQRTELINTTLQELTLIEGVNPSYLQKIKKELTEQVTPKTLDEKYYLSAPHHQGPETRLFALSEETSIILTSKIFLEAYHQGFNPQDHNPSTLVEVEEELTGEQKEILLGLYCQGGETMNSLTECYRAAKELSARKTK